MVTSLYGNQRQLTVVGKHELRAYHDLAGLISESSTYAAKPDFHSNGGRTILMILLFDLLAS